MNLTAPTPVSPRPVRGDNFEDFAKRELTPLLRQLRDFANQREHAQAILTTHASGATETIWSEDMPDTVSWNCRAIVTGRATAGGSARVTYEIAGLFYRDGGALTQQGATATLVAISSVVGFFVQFSISANTLRVQVLDDGLRTMNWTAVVIVQEAR